jgi:hypothetical protein
MIIRAWHGWTTGDRAGAFEHLVNETLAPGIMARGIGGLRELAFLRRVPGEGEGDGATAEFLTLLTFDDWTGVTQFAAPDMAMSVVPPEAGALLVRSDTHPQHYEVLRRHLPPG